ncbi:MAG: C4-type zinc ribbon domain-containing protein [Candidatus Omnitrophica bacterium]|nr:C4-type zinc ribbon domain-containing protein [Candidatus Omnitrophota bacterium]
MNRYLALLLQLQELALMRKAQAVIQPQGDSGDFAALDQKINKLRHKLPGPILSHFDHLMRHNPDAVVPISDGQCAGCHQEIDPQMAARAHSSRELVHCPHCQRFIFPAHQAPPFVELK